ncbi:MAG: alpha-1,2-fucosyltransferase [Bacteroidetes bacterium]|nr:alpha-1,2-fucosyltransferase [Bacteroidota bacterium]
MLIIKIHYGLGNQMFQYALGRRLSIEKKTEFKLDVSFFSKQRPEESQREYSLSGFFIQEQIASRKEILEFESRTLLSRFKNFFERLFLPYYLRSIVFEKGPVYDAKVLRTRNHCYLNGYWQQEKYFKPIEKLLRQDFTFRGETDEINDGVLSTIKSKETPVAIHIRRGDYLSDSMILSVLHQCTMDYYLRATNYIASCTRNPFFFIFSDDYEWVKENFKINHPSQFITNYNSEKPLEDLRLMSACSHFVIANSSFSWWAAWLGQAKDKIVVAPEKWYKNGLNIACEEWVRM